MVESTSEVPRAHLAAIGDTAILGTVTLRIHTFAPELYRVKRALPVAVERRRDGYVATFVEANVSSSGATLREAFENVKVLILDVFDSLSAMSPSRLGPGPARQLAILREFFELS
jgi:predicted RNase H-like HicB family nuclease